LYGAKKHGRPYVGNVFFNGLIVNNIDEQT